MTNAVHYFNRWQPPSIQLDIRSARFGQIFILPLRIGSDCAGIYTTGVFFGSIPIALSQKFIFHHRGHWIG